MVFFLMIRRPPRSTLDRSSAASDVYKRQEEDIIAAAQLDYIVQRGDPQAVPAGDHGQYGGGGASYTPLRAHETAPELVCRLLL